MTDGKVDIAGEGEAALALARRVLTLAAGQTDNVAICGCMQAAASIVAATTGCNAVAAYSYLAELCKGTSADLAKEQS